MSDVYDIIIQPVVSEKSARQMEVGNVYTFKVAGSANKIDIARAVEKLFDVTVLSVRTMNYAGKARRASMARMTRNQAIGRRSSFKKAVVTLAEGDRIEFYEAG
jgi:large subunit ribosomal protein L23